MHPGSSERTADTAAWLMLSALALCCALASDGTGFRIDPLRALGPAVGVLALLAGMIVGIARNRPRLAAGATAFLQMTLFTILGVVLAYALAAQAPATARTAAGAPIACATSL